MDDDLTQIEENPDPIVRFARWYADASTAGLAREDAVCLATATREGVPSARMVLSKGFDERGFVFFTNYESRKGRELEENPRAALVFYWAELGRQVRVGGAVERVPTRESDEYFASRPRESRLAALASRQSRPIESRAALEAEFERVAAEHPGDEVPRPPFWGGFRMVPSEIEFWVTGTNRLHDRLRYVRDGDGWRVERLSP